ncbi:MAG TPA: ribonuclease HI family protein [Polyangiaceae bacterium]|nr:ribonuclease HI family protein [Polyangiaceae bacterium]
MQDLPEAILWTDGAARGNPGPAAAGVVLKTPEGEVLLTENEYLGETTNNVAEYRALLLGLTLALERGIQRIEVRADSELLIKQLLGKYRVQSPHLIELHRQARELLQRFAASKLVHVRREYNAEADYQANLAIKQNLRASRS